MVIVSLKLPVRERDVEKLSACCLLPNTSTGFILCLSRCNSLLIRIENKHLYVWFACTTATIPAPFQPHLFYFAFRSVWNEFCAHEQAAIKPVHFQKFSPDIFNAASVSITPQHKEEGLCHLDSL